MSNVDPAMPVPPRSPGMSGGQIFALIGAILLLFPGLCFAGFGVGFLADKAAGMPELGMLLGGIGLAIFAVVWLLFRVALRRRPMPDDNPSDMPR